MAMMMIVSKRKVLIKEFAVRRFSSDSRLETKVCIVGCGPVGMTLSGMLNRFRIPNVIIEKHSHLQGRPV